MKGNKNNFIKNSLTPANLYILTLENLVTPLWTLAPQTNQYVEEGPDENNMS